MKIPRILRALCVVPLLAVSSHLRADPVVTDLWPDGIPGLKPNAGAEVHIDGGIVANIHHPTLTYFAAPKDKANGTAVIVAPGGGYARLSFAKEGLQVAERLNTYGITAFVLKYRVKEYGQPYPLQDVLQAIRLVRSRAAEFGLDPARIGICGFSAGGHVAASAGTMWDAPEGRTGGKLDSVNGRPDFMLLIYPVITMTDPYVHAGSRTTLIGSHPSADAIRHWSPEQNIRPDTPPAFLVSTEEDKTVPFQNTVMMFEALKAAKVPAEMHVFEKGPHGFGLRDDIGPAGTWPELAVAWLRLNGFLPKQP
jgi:acetyl esterase/lipase